MTLARCAMDLSFGARLRLQRERQQVPLTAIAERTKIKASLLDGLERDDLSHWPGGIFRRSYVRAYAHAIGLEPEAVVGEFLARYPEPTEDVPGALADREETSAGKRPTTRLGYLISSAINALPTLRPHHASPDVRDVGDERGRHILVPPDRVSIDLDTEAPLDTRMRFDDEGREDAADLDEAFMHSMILCPPCAEADDAPLLAVAEEVPSPEAVVLLAVDPAPAFDAAPVDLAPVDLMSVADLCTRLGRVLQVRDVKPVLADAARLIDAVGLILWTWDSNGGLLRPAIAHGYPDELVAKLPRVRPEDDNAIAWAFRSGETRVIEGSGDVTGAVAAPLITSDGCAGVLAFEVRNGAEGRSCVRALAAILSAQLSTLVEGAIYPKAVNA